MRFSRAICEGGKTERSGRGKAVRCLLSQLKRPINRADPPILCSRYKVAMFKWCASVLFLSSLATFGMSSHQRVSFCSSHPLRSCYHWNGRATAVCPSALRLNRRQQRRQQPDPCGVIASEEWWYMRRFEFLLRDPERFFFWE